MNSGELLDFANRISHGPIKMSNGEIWMPCPFAPYTHEKRKDSSPSFSFKIGPPGSSVYHCFTCGKRGPNTLHFCKEMEYYDKYMIFSSGALRLAMIHDQEDVGALGTRLFGMLTNGLAKAKNLANIATPEEDKRKIFDKAGLSEDTLSGYTVLPANAIQWLHGKGPLDGGEECRGLPKEASKKYELLWDEQQQSVIFPIRDFSGRLVGTTRRSPYRKTGPKFMDRAGFEKTIFFYGEKQLPKTDTIALVEGVFDTISLGTRGIPALGVMGTKTLSPFKATRLKEHGIKRILIIPDGDDAGYTAGKEWLKLLTPLMEEVEIFPTPSTLDPDDIDSTSLIEALYPRALPF